jgi:hypothetical protein
MQHVSTELNNRKNIQINKNICAKVARIACSNMYKQRYFNEFFFYFVQNMFLFIINMILMMSIDNTGSSVVKTMANIDKNTEGFITDSNISVEWIKPLCVKRIEFDFVYS